MSLFDYNRWMYTVEIDEWTLNLNKQIEDVLYSILKWSNIEVRTINIGRIYLAHSFLKNVHFTLEICRSEDTCQYYISFLYDTHYETYAFDKDKEQFGLIYEFYYERNVGKGNAFYDEEKDICMRHGNTNGYSFFHREEDDKDYITSYMDKCSIQLELSVDEVKPLGSIFKDPMEVVDTMFAIAQRSSAGFDFRFLKPTTNISELLLVAGAVFDECDSKISNITISNKGESLVYRDEALYAVRVRTDEGGYATAFAKGSAWYQPGDVYMKFHYLKAMDSLIFENDAIVEDEIVKQRVHGYMQYVLQIYDFCKEKSEEFMN